VDNPPCIRQRPFGIAGALHSAPSRRRARQRGAASALIRRSLQVVAWGSSFIFAAPPPSRFALTPRLHLPGHHRLPALADLDMLVNVLNKHVLLAPRGLCCMDRGSGRIDAGPVLFR
jgi:hypothetical protein